MIGCVVISMSELAHWPGVSDDERTLFKPVCQIVRRAGRLFQKDDTLRIQKKSAANYVTDVDLAVQNQIVRALLQLTPDYDVIAEESDSNPSDSECPTWILDPVDGTTNLMRGYRHSAISLALARENQLRLGIIFNPYTDELFTAISGEGAKRNDDPIKVSRYDRLSDCLIGFGTTPYARENADKTFSLVKQVFLQSLEIRRSGSAALDLAYVACGRLDAFFELYLQPWDYAAGALILKEAGGVITDWQGNPPSFRQGGSILATNGLVHPPLQDLIQNHLRG